MLVENAVAMYNEARHNTTSIFMSPLANLKLEYILLLLTDYAKGPYRVLTVKEGAESSLQGEWRKFE